MLFNLASCAAQDRQANPPASNSNICFMEDSWSGSDAKAAGIILQGERKAAIGFGDASDREKSLVNPFSIEEYPQLARFRGRRLTVGCPVVVSPLPREWSCLYRRGHPQNSFLAPQKYFAVVQSGPVCAVPVQREPHFDRCWKWKFFACGSFLPLFA